MSFAIFVRTHTNPLAVNQTRQLEVAFFFKRDMLRSVTIKSHLVKPVHLHAQVSSVIIWPQAGQEAEYLVLKINFLDSELVSTYLNFVLSNGIAVLGILRSEKLEGN